MTQRAAIYCRVSSRDQVEGHSLAYQLEDCRKAAELAGYDVVAQYSDEGISGKTIHKRLDFQQLVVDAKAGQFDALYVWKWERLARNREDSIVFKNLLRRQGIKVLAAKDPGGGDTPADALIEGVLESVAEWYSVDLRQKVSRSRQRRADLGLHNGPLPFGYKAHPESTKGHPLPPIVEPTEADLVRQAFTMYAGGTTSMMDIARVMNDAGVRTRNTRKDEGYGLTGPRPWGKESVKDMLGNVLYKGLISYRGELRPGAHMAIVPADVWDKVAAMRKQRHSAPAVYTPAYRRYQLKGLVRCVNCGERLWSNGTKRGAYYRDPSAQRGLDCRGGSVPVATIDTQMDAIMGRLSLPASWREEITALYSTGDNIANPETNRQRYEDRKRRVARLYADGMMTDAEYGVARLELEATESALVVPAHQEAIDAAGYLDNLGVLWAQMDDGEKWEALQVMIEAVYVNLQTKRLVGVRTKPAFRQVFLLCAGSAVCDWRPGGDSGHLDTDGVERWQAIGVA